jgi:hypothetical protein
MLGLIVSGCNKEHDISETINQESFNKDKGRCMTETISSPELSSCVENAIDLKVQKICSDNKLTSDECLKIKNEANSRIAIYNGEKAASNQAIKLEQTKQQPINNSNFQTSTIEQQRTPAVQDRKQVSVSVSLPENAITSNGTVITIPVTTTDLTGRGVISYNFDFHFDPSVLKLTTDPVQTTGTISNSCNIVTNSNKPGQLFVGCDVINELSGAGTLLTLQFNVIGASGSKSDLTFQEFIYNDGKPNVQTNKGTLRVTGNKTTSKNGVK